jgi:tRNA (guanine10-N2)-dimethyltransferase
MRALVFELSGEHGTLPKSEVIGCIEAYGWPYRVTAEYDQAIIIETDADPDLLANGSPQHPVMLFVCPADEAAILEKAGGRDPDEGTELCQAVPGKNYSEITSGSKKPGAAIWHRGPVA